MTDFPSSANVVVIGAGIVGNSVVGHLAKLGWRDIVQLDKGPLPNPGGSTGLALRALVAPIDLRGGVITSITGTLNAAGLK